MAEEEACDEEAVCYLCLDGEVDEADRQPLRRDCACRGTDAGFVHLSCLTEYAATKSEQANEMNEFVNPWFACPSCHQNYQNELGIHIATKFVLFVRRQYPDDTQLQVEALYLKLVALNSMIERLQPVQKREAGVTANVLISLIDRMKNDAPLTTRYSQCESYAYGVHGLIALTEGSEESARRAVAHFEKYLKVNEANSFADGIATAKAKIAAAKSLFVGDNTEELVKASQELYETRVAEYGYEDDYTIDAGIDYAINLRKANRGDEARDLLTMLFTTSKQILGPQHNTTKRVESELEEVIEVAK